MGMLRKRAAVEKMRPLDRWTNCFFDGAEDEVRTRDPQLGKLMLYQLSYFRLFRHRKDNRFPKSCKIFLHFSCGF